MDIIEPKEKNKKKKSVHYQKINVFGEDDVGKSTLISYFENYNNKEFSIKNDKERTFSNGTYNIKTSLIDDIKRVEIDINQDKHLYFYVYETSLNRYENIKMNLDVLLVQTECIIVIWDNSCPDTFNNIPNFISAIESGMKQYQYLNIPIIVIQNKMDSMLENSFVSIDKNTIVKKINNFKKEHPKVIYKELSLNEKDKFIQFVSDLYNDMDKFRRSLINYIDNDIYNIKFRFPLNEIKLKEPLNPSEITGCLLLGNSGVGKTSFIRCLLGKDITKHLSTKAIDKHMFKSKVNEKTIYIEINDTAGQEKFSKNLPSNYYKIADCILLFYDIMNKESFDNLNNWIKGIKEVKGERGKYKIFLIGNKIDNNENRVVEKKAAKKLAETYKIKYFECSCLNKINIYEILNEIALLAYKNDSKNIESVRLNSKIGDKKKDECC